MISALVVLACVMAFAGVLYGVFRFWTQRQLLRLEANGRMWKTALGPVECAVAGKGIPVLIIPGCPGGYDQAILAADLVATPGLQFLAVSRPGYLRTPLSVGQTPEAQADAYAALLDTMGIAKVAVVGVSGGGPSALQFALRYPERCWALTTICAISHALSRSELEHCKSLGRRISFAFCLGVRVAAAVISEWCRKWYAQLVRGRSGVGLPSTDVSSTYLGLLRAVCLFRFNRHGLENDARQLVSLPRYSLGRIAVPTLVMHGTADSLVPYAHAEFIMSQVPGATALTVPEGDHLFFAKDKERLLPRVVDFIQKHTEPPLFVDYGKPAEGRSRKPPGSNRGGAKPSPGSFGPA